MKLIFVAGFLLLLGFTFADHTDYESIVQSLEDENVEELMNLSDDSELSEDDDEDFENDPQPKPWRVRLRRLRLRRGLRRLSRHFRRYGSCAFLTNPTAIALCIARKKYGKK